MSAGSCRSAFEPRQIGSKGLGMSIFSSPILGPVTSIAVRPASARRRGEPPQSSYDCDVRPLIATTVAISAVFAAGLAACQAPPRGTSPALVIADYAAMPITGTPDGDGNNAGSLARINFLREEPAPAGRLFVNDLTGPLYILDKTTKR